MNIVINHEYHYLLCVVHRKWTIFSLPELLVYWTPWSQGCRYTEVLLYFWYSSILTLTLFFSDLQVLVTAIPSRIASILNVSWTYPPALITGSTGFICQVEYAGECDLAPAFRVFTRSVDQSVRSEVFVGGLVAFSSYNVTVFSSDGRNSSTTATTLPLGKA